jgi:hypothetical protein
VPFAAALRKALEDRRSEVPAELKRGDTLERILNRHLRTVEEMGGDNVFACVLLLSPDGKRLSFGAGPSIPASYARPGDSFEVGMSHGSCAAAVYLCRAVYSIDIATDPIWADFRNVALQHGYRSCWSTPIHDSNGAIIGTFAILHRTVGMPTHEEIEAIKLITGHVADAIIWSRDSQLAARCERHQSAMPKLKLVSDNQEPSDAATRLLALAERLHSKADELDGYADRAHSEAEAENLREAAKLSRELSANIILRIGCDQSAKPV